MHRRRGGRAPLHRQLLGLGQDGLVLRAVLHAVVQVPHLVAALHLQVSKGICHASNQCDWEFCW